MKKIKIGVRLVLLRLLVLILLPSAVGLPMANDAQAASPANLYPDVYRFSLYRNPNMEGNPGVLFTAWMDVHFVNDGPGDASSVTAVIVYAPANVTVIDGAVTLGNIPSGGGAWSMDFFVLRTDMTHPSDPNDMIIWQVAYDDADGVHHVVIPGKPATYVSLSNKDVQTTVTVNGGGSGAPLVKVSWEQDLMTSLEDGDPLHKTVLSQFLPPLVKNGKKPLQYWAIVTDPDGANTIAGVTVDVFHPNNSPAPYNANNFFKYQIMLQKVDQATGLAAYIKARDAGLVTFQQNSTPPITDADVLMELDKGIAYVYMGQQDIDYEQPAGRYTVKVDAWDSTNVYAGQATPPLSLINQFLYVAVNGIEVDFNAVNYGSVAVSGEKWIAGDTVWQTPAAPAPAPNPATVRNIGNTWAKITVKQNDMGFGFSGATSTAYSGPTPPSEGQSNWNVVFDARMGSNPANAIYYDPNVQITLPNVLTLSNQDELDFSIHVIKSPQGSKIGQMIIGSVAVPFP